MGKEELYFDMGGTAVHNRETKTHITSVTGWKQERKETYGWFQIPAPQLCFELHHGFDVTSSDYLVSWFSSPPSGILDSSCLCLKGYSHYSTGALFCP